MSHTHTHTHTDAHTEIDLDRPTVIDRLPSERYPVYTRANVSEIWPGPALPLTYTTQAGMPFDIAWRRALVRLGAFDDAEFDPDHEVMIGVFYGYPYLNVSVQRVFGVRMPGASPAVIDESFFGHQEGVPPYQPHPQDDSSEHTARLTDKIGEILTAPDLSVLQRSEPRIRALRAERPDLTTMSTAELWAYIAPLIYDVFGELQEEHLYIINASSIPIGILQSVATAVGDSGLAIRALSGIGEVASAEPSYAMWDMSRAIRASTTLTAIFDQGVDGIVARLEAAGDDDAVRDLRARLDAFLREFGSRGPNEMDPGSPSWETAPEMALAAIERMRLQPDSVSPRAAGDRLAQDRERVSGELLEKVAGDPGTHAQLELALSAVRVWLPARELSKFLSVIVVNEVRIALAELGRRLVAAGALDAPSDVMMLRYDEMPSLVAEPSAWTEEVRRRRDWFRALQDVEPPFITVGRPGPPSTWPRRRSAAVTPVHVGEVITGIAACPGTASGVARVITDPTDCADLGPGDVLIAPATDPAWTPLFLSAAAVVVDIGAPLSHAAIVSRELGIPCVVSAAQASRRIPDGARVTVNATAGTVTIDQLPPVTTS